MNLNIVKIKNNSKFWEYLRNKITVSYYKLIDKINIYFNNFNVYLGLFDGQEVNEYLYTISSWSVH